MSSWINLRAIGEILLVGLLAGAGLPALVALGLLALNPAGQPRASQPRPGLSPVSLPPAGQPASASAGVTNRPAPARVAVAALCFAVVLAAIGYGIYLIVKSGH